MASITIRNIDKSLKERLRVRAAQHGRSMEEEVRTILKETFALESVKPRKGLADTIKKRFEPFDGVDLPEIPREPLRDPVDFT